MKKITIILFSFILGSNVFANSDVIQKWDDTIAPKGYILSLDLYNNKKCSNIWTKQIKAFIKENPQVSDANLILINQKIKVQDCKIQADEVVPELVQQIAKKESVIEEKPYWFVGIFTGLSKLGSKVDDTAKEGSSLGLKVGKILPLSGEKHLSLALGFMQNTAETNDENNILGSYSVKSSLFTGEASLLYPVWKLQLGPKVMVVAGDDTSFRERGDKQPIGLYGGISILSRITKSLDFEVDFQQKMEDRLNILGNIGLRYNF